MSEVLVLTAINEEELAEQILIDLVSEGFILSGNIIPVKTVFMWEGQIHIDDEFKLLMKAREGYYSDIERYIMDKHPYRSPEIIKVDANFGSEEFRKKLMSNKKL
ncbi:MAG: divalent-cation tolerance protein CutA [Leptospirales bacterium]|nr:divalent-cation tolerance protein CutA [Leptospirales bacterium]